ncbi:hypothetical protein SNOG_03296 [Parastagonospora nodorum SN15]|uniref:PQ loop repeat protein n=1 Tax=Phaeosphaeria nodorum (strain SN15 / ATCC MYA-4574 / FGSC 10173) TaxID=321614 RepID=Q0UY68_PHANO|nr:hypothetical protein SNOG_03296 [Parastagonospora nodorum SN15]EAT90027.1 hypothetical protein SNOG_03296 [Parastagonospora nodorum SN15]
MSQLIPQIVINYRRHNATGLQPTMMMLWAWAGVPLGVYNIAEEFNVALRIQPQILTLLSLKWTLLRALAVVIPITFLMGSVQAGLIVGVRQAKKKDIEWPATLMAVASAVLLAAGVLRHYLDVYIHRTVRGISFIFVGIDALGDVFSLVSVVFQSTVDIAGVAIYATELVLWIGIFMCGAYYNLGPWVRLQRVDAEHGVTAATETREGESASAAGISLHDLPSSTSVFRTPSGEVTRRGAST